MRILLVGGTGVLGRAAVPLLTAAGHDAHVVSRRSATDERLRTVGATAVRVPDVFVPGALRDAAAEVAPDAVLRLATHIPPTNRALLPRAWSTNDRLRRDLAAELADIAIDHGARYVGESIVLAYADGGGTVLDEAAPLAPTGPVATVAAAEAAVARVAAHGPAGVSLRFGLFHGVGTGQSEETVEMAARGWLSVPGHAEAHVSFVDVRDAARAVVAALDLPSGAYNVVEDHPATRAEHANALASLVGRRVRTLPRLVARLPRVRPVARSLRVSNARLRRHGWAPATPRTADAWPPIAAGARDAVG